MIDDSAYPDVLTYDLVSRLSYDDGLLNGQGLRASGTLRVSRNTRPLS